MTNVHKVKLEKIAEDSQMIEALTELFEEINKLPVIEESHNSTLIGERYRAYVQAREMFDDFFKAIISCKKEASAKQEFNKER